MYRNPGENCRTVCTCHAQSPSSMDLFHPEKLSNPNPKPCRNEELRCCEADQFWSPVRALVAVTAPPDQITIFYPSSAKVRRQSDIVGKVLIWLGLESVSSICSSTARMLQKDENLFRLRRVKRAECRRRDVEFLGVTERRRSTSSLQ